MDRDGPQGEPAGSVREGEIAAPADEDMTTRVGANGGEQPSGTAAGPAGGDDSSALDVSAMAGEFSLIGRLLARAAFNRIRVDSSAVQRVRELATDGTVVYVLHQRSVIDYLMVNAVLRRERLPLPQFAGGVSAVWLWPLRSIVQLVGQRIRSMGLFSREVRDLRTQDRCIELIHQGVPVLIFMRNPRRRWRRRSAEAATETVDYLRSIVHSLWGRSTKVHLVPIAIFRGAGYPKREARRRAVFYIVREFPGEAKRLFAYLWNRRHTVMTIGGELPVQQVIEQHRYHGEEQIVSRLTRGLHGFLYNEERVVWGPPLRARSVVRDAVLSGGEMAALVPQLARDRRVPEEKVWKEAESAFDEMAANFDGLYFGIIASVFKRVWARIFSGLEIMGFDKVVACLRQHPVVLVPCHRSHFDYLILSYVFYERVLSPLHIAAGINLAFWPLGPLFRGAGAFFIRRSFGDNPLYKLVFRNYLGFLIREGYTQEFFIEGGRTRTGKMLAPKLGMLSAIVNAFTQGVREELYLVPVSIHYGRIVEGEAYKREVKGEEKERESLRSLLRARAVLRQRYGSVYVSFGEPISLSDALGTKKDRFLAQGGQPEVEEEKRYFIKKLGFRILREVNSVAVAGATPVSATALLAARRPAMRVGEFLQATSLLTDLLRSQGVRFTASLERNLKDRFQESIAWLGSHGLVQRVEEADVDVLHVPPDKRINLDFYKNNVIHFFLIPSLMARALRAGVEVGRLKDELWWWLDLYRWEFPLPEREALAVQLGTWLEYLRAAGALRNGAADPDHPLFETAAGILENFREAYEVTARTVAAQGAWPVSQKALVEKVRRAFSVSQLLGEVSKPEADSVVTYANALNRFAELGYIEVTTDGRGGKERRVTAGPDHDGLDGLVERLRAG